MKMQRKPLAAAISSLGAALLLAGTNVAAEPYEVEHVFSVDDLQVDFRGTTYGSGGTASDPDAICDIDGGPACPGDVGKFTDKDGIELFPVDTEFGFSVVDFLGAQENNVEEPRDYGEGFIGNIEDGGEVVGVKISNAETDTYKVKPPLGTWCQGLGGNSVKCSTEHYSVMEHALSCNEVIPYYFYDFEGDTQQYNEFPDGSEGFSCGDAALDDYLLILDEGVEGDRLTSVIPLPAPGGQMHANDNTTVRRDIATSSDYSVTLKDDGKPLYRWGGLIKRPNDIRLYAKLELPASWKARDEGGALVNDYAVHDAKLYVTHWITNNPNDQLRPEDLENEAATGRKPSYYVEDGDWKSLISCFEGDGDFLESDGDTIDPTPLAAGTLFKNSSAALDPASVPGISPQDPPFAFSSDLVGGFTNGYYTTIDRDPFEWSYVDSAEAALGTYDFVGSPEPLDLSLPENDGLELVSGPRWRLKPNKFGQDIPGLEIPLVECSEPPFGHDNIRYEVGTLVTTVINLLDWDEEEGPSPLATTQGWVEINEFVEEGDSPEGYTVTTNGLPMTEDFDLAVYVKGDRKPTALYSARLVVDTDEVPSEPPPGITADDLSLSNPDAPDAVAIGVTRTVEVQVNNSAEIAAVDVAQVRFYADGELVEEVPVRAIEPGSSRRAKFKWTPEGPARTVNWTMDLIFDGEVIDTELDSTIVR